MGDGILLINKPIGMTSRDVVNYLCKKFNTKKMGHTGTLDPFASGLMIVTINKGTKISSFMEDLTKTYVAEIKLGQKTTTLDLDGEIIEEKIVDLPLDKKQVLEVIHHYVGDIEQIPPMYSAIKIDGEPLYKKARRGEEIIRKPRKVTINYINLLNITKEKLFVEVDCSKGTYIRTLGSDIADELGYGGHLTLLCRTRVGKYKLKDAKTIEEVTLDDVIPINKALDHLPFVIVEGNLERMVRNGVSLRLGSQPLVLVKSKLDEAIAIYQIKEDGKHHCLRGLL
ncbi:MAG: tRNA pseudouridine(55) synthase TruB [Bacillales bacterium]|nr:tRNA pseudouridine(55) synthase TruB [Bacillales bacterium]